MTQACIKCKTPISVIDGPYVTLSDGRCICSRCLWMASQERKAREAMKCRSPLTRFTKRCTSPR